METIKINQVRSPFLWDYQNHYPLPKDFEIIAFTFQHLLF
jgi:hypothetical protein